jgi:hypothetical protein
MDFHWLLGKRVKVNSLQAISDGLALQAPLTAERLALRLDLLLRADVDHILNRGMFVMQPIGSISEKVAVSEGKIDSGPNAPTTPALRWAKG